MIDPVKFREIWAHLCARFNREVDANLAVSYLEYLTELMDTEEFVIAARAVWATGRFFPRPADFVVIRAGLEWPTVLECLSGFHPPDWPWQAPWKDLSPRAQSACHRLGGISAMAEEAVRGVTRLRESYQTAYEEEATAEALALPAASVRQ